MAQGHALEQRRALRARCACWECRPNCVAHNKIASKSSDGLVGSRVCHCLGVVRARRVPPAPPMCMVTTPAARRGRPAKGAGLANAPKLSRAGACSKTMGLQVLSWIPWWFSPPPIKMVQPCSFARPWRGECAAHSFLPAPCPCCSCWSPVRRALKPTPVHLRIAAWFQGGRVSG